MKINLSLALIVLSLQSYCQPNPALVSVTFPDNKSFYANLVSDDGYILKAQIYNSGAVYEFNKAGKIVSSTGSYTKGSAVSAIGVKRYKADLYRYNIIPRQETIGVGFPDGNIYYGHVEDGAEGWFAIRFLHSNSLYTMQLESGLWKVNSTDKGKYAPGTTITKLFSLETNEPFF